MSGWWKLAAVALCAVPVSCAQPASSDGGAAGRRPEKARTDAEALALSAVNGAADAQAKALPALRREPEVPAEQVRAQRSQERVGPTVRGLGGLVAVALAAFLFLRADRWTKGALRVWLAPVAVALAAGGVAAAVLA